MGPDQRSRAATAGRLAMSDAVARGFSDQRERVGALTHPAQRP